MIEGDEFFALLLALVFAPLIVRTMRGALTPARRYITIGLVSIVASDVCTIAEGFVAREIFNAAEHIFFALAGIAFAMAALVTMNHLSPPRRGDRA